MSTKKIVFETEDKMWRILEISDSYYDLENLKGDCFNPEVNKDIDAETLRKEEKEFENRVNDEGVFGYVLENWDATPGVGYTLVDSCWGFVGQFNPKFEIYNHYIVEELKGQIK